MRILYFPSYINKYATTEKKMKDCNLVIDALTFFYNTYEESEAISAFSSEADVYAKYLKTKLQMFKKANIKCYFVFDGGENDKNKIIQRFMNNTDVEYYKFISVFFITDICLQVLEEEGMKYATSVTPGKDDCLSLARKLNCPILSNSVNFCFKSTPYIPLNTLKFANGHLICRQYDLKNFLTQHKITERKAAIFAALSDIKLFPQFYFDDLLNKWDIFHNKNFTNHKDLLKWLSNHSENEILNDIREFISDDSEFNKLTDYIDKVLVDMESNDHDSVLAEYLHDVTFSVDDQDPLWFEKGIVTQKIATPYINLYRNKLIKGARCLVQHDYIDTIMLSIDIIKYAYNLLTNYEKNGSFTVLQPAGQPVVINTDVLNIKKPKYKCEVSVFENGWTDIKQLKLFEHFLNENNIDLDKVEKVPRDARIFLIALAYFTGRKQSADVNVNKEVYCFIVCYVILEHSTRERDHLQKYFHCDVDEAKLLFDADTLRPLEEMYYCLLHMNYLNKLCGAPYKPTKYHKTFNGTFIYRLLLDMVSSECEPIDFIQNLFVSNPSVFSVINILIKLYHELC